MKSTKTLAWLALLSTFAGCTLNDIVRDADQDGTLDDDDVCPFNRDYDTSAHEVCGCGVNYNESIGEASCTCVVGDVYVCSWNNPLFDSDHDGVVDGEDACPFDETHQELGECGCGYDEDKQCEPLVSKPIEDPPVVNPPVDDPPVDDPPVDDPPVDDPPVDDPPPQSVCGNNLLEDGEECDGEFVECSGIDPKLAGIASCMNCQVVLSECGSDSDSDGEFDENDVCPFNPEIKNEDDYKTVGMASCASYKSGEELDERIEGYEIHLYPGSFLTNERLEKYPPGRIVIHGTINFYYKDMSNADMGMSVEHIVDDYLDGRPGIQFIPLKIPQNTEIVGVDNAKFEFVKDDKRGILTAPLFETLQNCTIKDLLIDLDFNNQLMTNVELRGSITNEMKSSQLNNVGYSGSLASYSTRPNIGGLVGMVDAASSLNDVYIENVNISIGENYNIQYVGGIAGQVQTSNVTVKESKNISVHGKNNVGGLFGMCNAAINLENLAVSEVDVAGNSEVGGIIGKMNSGGLSFAKSEVNINKLTCEGNYCGGLVGNIQSANFFFDTIDISIAQMTASSYSGGIVGQINHSTNNTGTINKLDCKIDNLGCTGSYCGGILGYISGSYGFNSNNVIISKIIAEVNQFGCSGNYCAGLIGRLQSNINFSDILLIVKKMEGNHSSGIIAEHYNNCKFEISRLVSLVQFSQNHNYALFWNNVSPSFFTPKDIYWYKLEDDYATNISSLSQEAQNEIQPIVPQKTDVHQVVKKLRSEVMTEPDNDCDWSDDKIKLPMVSAEGGEAEIDIPMLSWKPKVPPS